MIPFKMHKNNLIILISLVLQKIRIERFVLYPIVYYLLSESLGQCYPRKNFYVVKLVNSNTALHWSMMENLIPTKLALRSVFHL